MKIFGYEDYVICSALYSSMMGRASFEAPQKAPDIVLYTLDRLRVLRAGVLGQNILPTIPGNRMPSPKTKPS